MVFVSCATEVYVACRFGFILTSWLMEECLKKQWWFIDWTVWYKDCLCDGDWTKVKNKLVSYETLKSDICQFVKIVVLRIISCLLIMTRMGPRSKYAEAVVWSKIFRFSWMFIWLDYRILDFFNCWRCYLMRCYVGSEQLKQGSPVGPTVLSIC